MNLRTKIKRAKLSPIDEATAQEVMRTYGVDKCHWDYYKLCGDTYKVFTKDYIMNNSIEEITKYD